MASSNLAIYNGTTAADGSLAILVRGDPYHMIIKPASIDAFHAITWSGYSTLDAYGSYTSSWGTRPVLCFAYVTVFQTGDPHVITAHSYRSPPAIIGTQIGTGPTQTNYGVTSTQRTLYQGLDSGIVPGNAAKVMCHQSRGSADVFLWNQCTSDRGASAYEGTYFWLFGLKSTDRVEMTYGAYAEYYPLSAAVVLGSAPTAVSASSMVSDLVLGASDALSNVGADVMIDTPDESRDKSVLSQVSRKITDMASSDIVENSVDAITDFVEGNFWGAAKHAWGAISGIFSVGYWQPQRLRMIDGSVLVAPPILPRAPAALPVCLHGYMTAHESQGLQHPPPAPRKSDKPSPALDDTLYGDTDDDFPVSVTSSSSSSSMPVRARSIPPTRKA
jgi:hypothetical protein